ncbi:hypothetical protein V8D89_003778 [Ganoderma adspersum]
MLYNGMIYFIVLSLINIFQLVLAIGFSLAPDGLTILYFASPLSSVLVSHFLLDLQEAYQRTVAGVATDGPLDTSRILHSSINLANALGSIGAIVDPAANYILEEDDNPQGVHDGVCHFATPESIRLDECEVVRELRTKDESIAEVPRGEDRARRV